MGFEGLHGLAGRRGFGLVVGSRPDQTVSFILQHRAVESGEEDRLKAEGCAVSLVSELRLQFCPWCGRNLLKWYGAEVGKVINDQFLMR